MRKRTIAGLVIAGAVMFGAGLAVGQQTSEPEAKEAEFTKAVSWAVGRVTVNGESDFKTLSSEMKRAAGDPLLTDAIGKMAFRWDKRTSPTDTMLLVLQAQQNQRIIELLEKIEQRK